jgi:DNA helicase-2/ATP-dependent DNA helicase PcrA
MGKEGDWLVPSNLFDRKRYEGGEEDERRLFYVAVTRARDALCLSTFERIKAARPPSRFLSEAGMRVSEPPSGNFVQRIFKQQLKDTEFGTFAAGEIIVSGCMA